MRFHVSGAGGRWYRATQYNLQVVDYMSAAVIYIYL